MSTDVRYCWQCEGVAAHKHWGRVYNVSSQSSSHFTTSIFLLLIPISFTLKQFISRSILQDFREHPNCFYVDQLEFWFIRIHAYFTLHTEFVVRMIRTHICLNIDRIMALFFFNVHVVHIIRISSVCIYLGMYCSSWWRGSGCRWRCVLKMRIIIRIQRCPAMISFNAWVRYGVEFQNKSLKCNSNYITHYRKTRLSIKVEHLKALDWKAHFHHNSTAVLQIIFSHLISYTHCLTLMHSFSQSVHTQETWFSEI